MKVSTQQSHARVYSFVGAMLLAFVGLSAQAQEPDTSAQKPNEEEPDENQKKSVQSSKEPVAEATEDTPAQTSTSSGSGEVHALEQIVVTGTRSEKRMADVPVATEVITAEDIEKSGAENVADILEEHPGIQVDHSFRGQSISIQGLDSDYTLILVDGERTIGRTDGAMDLSRFSAEDIERIEIVRGASSALYGSDAIGGVVNIITKRCTKGGAKGKGHGSYGTLGSVDLSALGGYCQGPWNVRISVGHHARQAYDLDPEDVATDGSAFQTYNLQSRATYRHDKSTRVTSKLGYQRRAQAGIDSNGAGAVFDRKNLSENFSASVRPQFKTSGAAKLSFLGHYSLYRDQFVYDQRGSDALDQYQDAKEQLIEVSGQYERLVFSRHLLTLGTEFLHETLSAERLEGGQGQRYRLAAFVQDEWNLIDSPLLVVVPGARIDLDSQFGVHPTPKVAIRYDLHKSFIVRASYGWGYRAPRFKELLLHFENPSVGYVVQGNPDLEPENSRSINLGAQWRPTKPLWLSANLFHNRIQNLIYTDTVPTSGAAAADIYRYINVAQARTRGLESVLRAKLLSSLLLELGYTFTDTFDAQNRRPLQGRAKHHLTYSLKYKDKGLGLDGMVRGASFGARPFFVDDDGNGVDETLWANPYTKIDLRLAKTLWQEKLSVFVGAENLLGVGDPRFLPIPPRTFYGGLRAAI